ncbi:MAG: hypothetical protein IJD04_01995 [Desulfovibrionaceae bacterium]|nr:hypothetical protein [Desulfovibrionaceae bacterium]
MQYDAHHHLKIYEQERLKTRQQHGAEQKKKSEWRNELCSSLQAVRSELEAHTRELPHPYQSFFYGADGLERSNLLFCIADESIVPTENSHLAFSLRDMILAFPHMHFKVYNVRDKTIQVTIDDKECKKMFRSIVCRGGNHLNCLDSLLEEYMHAAFPHGSA